MSSVLTNLFLTLYNNAPLLALVDSFGSTKAIFNGMEIPDTFTGNNSVNFYNSTFVDKTLPFADERITINCRAATLSGAEAIKNAVVTAVNRKTLTAYGFFGTVTELPPIRPLDDTDNYNWPVEVRVKAK